MRRAKISSSSPPALTLALLLVLLPSSVPPRGQMWGFQRGWVHEDKPKMAQIDVPFTCLKGSGLALVLPPHKKSNHPGGFMYVRLEAPPRRGGGGGGFFFCFPPSGGTQRG